MKTNAYAIFDTASGCYQKLIFARADGEITREFQALCANAEHPVGQHPEDYSLFRLGSFCDQDGKLLNENNTCLATGLEMVALSRNPKTDYLKEVTEQIIKDTQE